MRPHLCPACHLHALLSLPPLGGGLAGWDALVHSLVHLSCASFCGLHDLVVSHGSRERAKELTNHMPAHEAGTWKDPCGWMDGYQNRFCSAPAGLNQDRCKQVPQGCRITRGPTQHRRKLRPGLLDRKGGGSGWDAVGWQGLPLNSGRVCVSVATSI